MNDQPVLKRRSDFAAMQTAFRMIGPVATEPAEPVLAVARLEIAARRRRRAVFGEDARLLGDAVWDALLELFVAEADGRLVSTTALVLAMHVPSSTGLRWIDHMEGRGLLTRETDSQDRRRCLIRPTARARALVTESLEPLWRERVG